MVERRRRTASVLNELRERAAAGDVVLDRWQPAVLDTVRGRELAVPVVRLDVSGSLRWGLWIGPPGARGGSVHAVGLLGDACVLPWERGWRAVRRAPPWFVRAASAYLESLRTLQPPQLDQLGLWASRGFL